MKFRGPNIKTLNGFRRMKGDADFWKLPCNVVGTVQREIFLKKGGPLKLQGYVGTIIGVWGGGLS